MYRTIDDIELKHKKNYDMVIANSVKFIKSDMINKAKDIQKMQEELEEFESESSSGSSSDSDSESDSEEK